MCNRYQVRTDLQSICRELQAQTAFDFEIPLEVFPKTAAPVAVINREGERELRPMVFGLGYAAQNASGAAGKPSSSDNPSGPTYLLNNTRIESHAKWPWKKSFEKYRCVVPMSSFREASYWGADEGSEISFFSTDDRLLLAAGLFTFETNDDGEHVFFMSVLMRPALPYVMQHGHHRSPFFLNPAGIDGWMSRGSRPAIASLEILRKHAASPELTHQVDRHMAVSWTKRKLANIKKRDEQIAASRSHGPLGFTLPD